jgi:hypothetical protein
VIVGLDNDTHWAVVVGYGPHGYHLMDPSLKALLLRDPYCPENWFHQRWDGSGMIVSRPG